MIDKEDYVTSKAGIVIKYNGSFDLDKLYKDIKAWFDNNSYDFDEKEYKEKRQAHGDEILIEFICERKIDDYIRFNLRIKFLMLNVKKLSKGHYIGNFRANIAAFIEFDYNNEWQYNPIKKILFFIYNNFIIKNKIESVYEDKLYNDVLSFEKLIKEHLEML